MAATNETTYYQLPLFTDNDQPTWLGDFNGAMNKIDNALNNIGANASTALSAANNSVNRVDTIETQFALVQSSANQALSLSQTNESGIAALDAQMAGTQPSELLNKINKIINDATPVKESGSLSIGGGTVTWETLETPLTRQMTVWLGIDSVTLDKTADVETYPVFTIPKGKRFDHNIQLFADSNLGTPASLVVYAEAATGVVRIQQGQGISQYAYSTDVVFTYTY
jgi:hypothetical protein